MFKYHNVACYHYTTSPAYLPSNFPYTTYILMYLKLLWFSRGGFWFLRWWMLEKDLVGNIKASMPSLVNEGLEHTPKLEPVVLLHTCLWKV